MTHIGEAYLAVIVVAFLSFVGTLFWSMVTSSSGPPGKEQHQGD